MSRQTAADKQVLFGLKGRRQVPSPTLVPSGSPPFFSRLVDALVNRPTQNEPMDFTPRENFFDILILSINLSFPPRQLRTHILYFLIQRSVMTESSQIEIFPKRKKNVWRLDTSLTIYAHLTNAHIYPLLCNCVCSICDQRAPHRNNQWRFRKQVLIIEPPY